MPNSRGSTLHASTDDGGERNSVLLMVMTLISRLLGIVKARVISSVFGAGALADSINYAYTIPNNLRKLFAEGSLSQAYLPLMRARSDEDESLFMSQLISFQIVVFLPLIAASFIFGSRIITISSGFTDPFQLEVASALFPFFMIFLFLISLSTVFSSALQVRKSFLITGAGLIGTMATAIARFAGAKNVIVTDLNDYRLDIARKMGATFTVNASKGETIEGAMKQLGISGFDVGLEMSGSPVAFRDMVTHMYNGSHIAQLGILPPTTTVDWSEIIFKALTIKGIYGRQMWETWYKMEQMLISGLDLTPVITHHYPVDDFQKGFDVMESGLCGKVILDWE